MKSTKVLSGSSHDQVAWEPDAMQQTAAHHPEKQDFSKLVLYAKQ